MYSMYRVKEQWFAQEGVQAEAVQSHTHAKGTKAGQQECPARDVPRLRARFPCLHVLPAHCCPGQRENTHAE